MLEEEQEKLRNELFDKMKPMVPQKQEWRRKGAGFAPPLPSSSGQTVAPGSPTASTPEATGASGGSSGQTVTHGGPEGSSPSGAVRLPSLQ